MEIGVSQNAEYFINGQQVIDYVKECVIESLSQDLKQETKPIHALLLDFQMPQKNGLQTVQEVKAFYAE